MRPRFEARVPFSFSQELSHSTTPSPNFVAERVWYNNLLSLSLWLTHDVKKNIATEGAKRGIFDKSQYPAILCCVTN